MDTEEGLREQAIALRRSGMSRRQIRDELKIWNNDRLNRLLKGEPPPEWTKRPNAKDDLREQARELRREGKTYDEIEEALGVSRSSVSLWVRDLPRPSPRRTRSELARLAAAERWEPLRAAREAERQRTKADAAGEIGRLSDRELFLLGVGLYWAEGTKDKAWNRRESAVIINSDPDVITVYLAWLALLGVERSRIRFRMYIHESADVDRAQQYWADLVGVDVAVMQRPTLKKHNPKTVRKNIGEGYRGCLAINVLGSAELYRRIEGWWSGMVVEVKRRRP
jgi:transcriptional regulator with XRE-family HTH domain